MIIDHELEMSRAQVVTGTAASSDTIDLSKCGNAENEPLELVIQVDEAATAAGDATVTFALQTDDDVAFGTACTLWTSPAIGKAALTLNSVVHMGKLPRGAKRYLRMYYTVATGPLLKGKFSAFLVNGVQLNSFA